MPEGSVELSKYLSEAALIFAAAAFAFVGGVFALFLRPKLKAIDEVKDDHIKLKTEFDSWRPKLRDLEAVREGHMNLKTEFDTLKVPENLNALQGLQTGVAVLQQSETQRNEKLNAAIESLGKLTRQMSEDLKTAIEAGDKDNQRRILEYRVHELWTAYTLSRIQGGSQEAAALDEWNRAKNELTQFLSKSQ